MSYARRTRDTAKILKLVRALPQSGYVRSRRTRGYLQRIADVLSKQLQGLEGKRALAVLAWAFRLMTTYQTQRGTRKAVSRKKPKR